MSDSFSFRPSRQRGLLFHSLAGVGLAAASLFAIFYGVSQQVGAYFVLLLLVALLLFAPLPLVIYRAYALAQAQYRLDRNGMRLRWGLRAEDIPLTEIEWVRRAADLAADLPRPWLAMPGALLGVVRAGDLGPVEYLASTTHGLVLIATPRRVYAISPEDPASFLRAYQETVEMGSLTPLAANTVLPAAYLTRVWADRLGRILLTTGLALTLLLFTGVSLAIPSRQTISLGFNPAGQPLDPVPAAQLLLLPVLGAFIYLADLAAGLFFYRRRESRLVTYLLWGSGATTALLLILASLMIL